MGIELTYKITASTSALRRALKKAVDSGALIQDGQRFKLDKDKRAELRKPAPKPKKKKKKVVKKKTKKKKKKKVEKKKTVKKNKKTVKKKSSRFRSTDPRRPTLQIR